MDFLFIGGIGMQEVLLIALVVLLFFGGKKIPELMKGLGKGVHAFRDGLNNSRRKYGCFKFQVFRQSVDYGRARQAVILLGAP